MEDTHDSLLCSQYFTDKVVLAGDNGVGKTSIFNRFLTGKFERNVGQQRVAEYKKRWEVDGKQVSMTLFDTAELEGLSRCIRKGKTVHPTRLHFSAGKAVLLVYSIDDVESFESLPTLLADSAMSRLSDTAVFVLVGNKIDLESERVVTRARAEAFAKCRRIPSDLIFEVSAKYNTNIQAMFDAVATKIQPAAKSTEKTVTEPPSNRRWKMC